jgi:hypothetical protein
MIRKNTLVATTVVGFALTLASLNAIAFAANSDAVQAPRAHHAAAGRGHEVECPRADELQAPRGQASSARTDEQDTERPHGHAG